ncbi:MAG: conjugal transfer protein TraF [Nitrospiraceae bacterium]
MRSFARLARVIGALLTVPLIVSTASAVEFVIVGPRAAGMGGAGVAVTHDALGTYWNPAGMALSKSWDIQVAGSAQIVDRLGLGKALKDINDADLNDTSPANIAKLQAIANRINQSGATTSGLGAAGLYFKSTFGSHVFGFNISDVATGGGFMASPVTALPSGGSVTVTGQVAVRALEARQAAFSYAYGFGDGKLAFGATAKIMQGAAYANLVNVRGAESGFETPNDLGKATISTAVGFDLGLAAKPVDWLRLGIVAKDINQPTFNAPGGEVKLLPQIRAGAALNPYESLTLTVDADLTSNKALIPNVKSRLISAGAEQLLFGDVLALRVGAFKNVEDANSIVTPTAGIGVKIFALRIDVGGGYDFREKGALASGAVSFTW